MIKVIYYDKGQYVQFKGKVAKLDFENKKIQIVKKTLDLNDIVEMDIEWSLFKNLTTKFYSSPVFKMDRTYNVRNARVTRKYKGQDQYSCENRFEKGYIKLGACK